MTTSITDGTTTLSFVVLDGYSAKRDTENVVHNIIGTTDNAVTLRGGSLRKGSLTGVIGASDAAMAQWDALLRQAKTFNLADTDHPSLNMKFVVSGSHAIELDEETRAVWTTTFDFEEVNP